MQRHHRLDTSSLLGVDITASDEIFSQGPGFIAGPDLEGGDELALIDQAVLQR
jgi:hypothetical protein